MPNPVAEVVERLRQNARNLADGTDFHNGRQLGPKDTLYWHAADLLERLSRERDTGVPEGQTAHEESEARLLGALQRNLALRVAMQRAAKIIKTNLYHQREKVADAETILLEALENSEPDAAAPQPTTVSTQGWQDTTGEPPRDWVIRKNGYFYRANRSGYTQEVVAAGRYTEAEAKAEARIEGITAHRASEFAADMPDMVAALTRERDQAYDDRQKFEQHLWRVIDDGNPPSVPSDLVDAVARIKSYANRVARERDQAREALAPFAAYAEARLRMPLNSLGDSVHTIHGGTEYEAEIRFSDCLRARSVLHPNSTTDKEGSSS